VCEARQDVDEVAGADDAYDGALLAVPQRRAGRTLLVQRMEGLQGCRAEQWDMMHFRHWYYTTAVCFLEVSDGRPPHRAMTGSMVLGAMVLAPDI
jgi:hypothetical protein